MKKIIIAAALLFTAPNLNARPTIDSAKNYGKHADSKRNNLNDDTDESVSHYPGFWYTPVWHNTVVNGVAVGFYTAPVVQNKTLVVNGLNIEADPLPLIVVPILALRMFVMVPEIAAHEHSNVGDTAHAYKNAHHTNDNTAMPETVMAMKKKDTAVKTRVHGLSISSGILQQETKMEGVSLNGACALENEISGVEVTGVVNWHYSFKGLIAALVNTTATGKGVQIGLYNDCKKGTLLQLGLINRIGNRVLPFANCSFKRKKQKLIHDQK